MWGGRWHQHTSSEKTACARMCESTTGDLAFVAVADGSKWQGRTCSLSIYVCSCTETVAVDCVMQELACVDITISNLVQPHTHTSDHSGRAEALLCVLLTMSCTFVLPVQYQAQEFACGNITISNLFHPTLTHATSGRMGAFVCCWQCSATLCCLFIPICRSLLVVTSPSVIGSPHVQEMTIQAGKGVPASLHYIHCSVPLCCLSILVYRSSCVVTSPSVTWFTPHSHK